MAELIPTTVVGSYPQPEWLVDRENLRSRLPPRIRAREIWRIPEPFLEQAQDDATLLTLAMGDQNPSTSTTAWANACGASCGRLCPTPPATVR
ncbi:MAG TPA: hypothetical protein VF812_14810 [Ktedonobacterales bacterium]